MDKENYFYSAYMRPIFTNIPLNFPIYDRSDIIGYESVDIENPRQHYWIKVQHKNIISNRLYPGDLVLVYPQETAKIGQSIIGISAKRKMLSMKKYQEGDIVYGVPVLIIRKSSR